MTDARIETIRQSLDIGIGTRNRLMRTAKVRKAIASDNWTRVHYLFAQHADRSPMVRLTRTVKKLSEPLPEPKK